jgi:hypothetical protein
MNEKHSNTKERKYPLEDVAFTDKFAARMSLFCSIAGLSSIFINMLGIPAFGLGAFFWGIAALVLALSARKLRLILLSLLVIPSFFIAIQLAIYSEGKSFVGVHNPELEGVYPVYHKGRVYNAFKADVYYLYFAKEKSEECDVFNIKLEAALIENPLGMLVLYYDVEKMPSEEVEDVMHRLNIDRIPYLVKLEKGNVVDYVTEPDEDRLREFFED